MTSPPCHSSQYKCKCPVKHWCTGAFMWLSAFSTYSTCSSSRVRQGCSSWSRPLWGAALSANRRHECVIWKINWSFREGKLRGLRWERGMHSFISSHNHVSHCIPCTASSGCPTSMMCRCWCCVYGTVWFVWEKSWSRAPRLKLGRERTPATSSSVCRTPGWRWRSCLRESRTAAADAWSW